MKLLEARAELDASKIKVVEAKLATECIVLKHINLLEKVDAKSGHVCFFA